MLCSIVGSLHNKKRRSKVRQLARANLVMRARDRHLQKVGDGIRLVGSHDSLQGKRKDAFTSVAVVVCLDGQISVPNQFLVRLQDASRCIIANSIASSPNWTDGHQSQIAH